MKTISDEALFNGPLYSTRRSLVLALRDAGGAIKDSGGSATAVLYNAAGCNDVSPAARPGLLKGLEAEGWIVRDVNGKRTVEIMLNDEHPDVQRILNHFPPTVEEEEVEDDVPEISDVDFGSASTPNFDALDVADALILRVVEILNNPTNEDLQHRLGQQIEACRVLRDKVHSLELEMREMKTEREALRARVRTLHEDNKQLESNIRAALRGDRAVVGDGVRALQQFMQQRPSVRN